MIGRIMTCCCLWSGNKKAAAQRQRMEAKIHTHHKDLEGANLAQVYPFGPNALVGRC